MYESLPQKGEDHRNGTLLYLNNDLHAPLWGLIGSSRRRTIYENLQRLFIVSQMFEPNNNSNNSAPWNN